MLEITPTITIPDGELRFEYSRSGGPGGQNVNKVASKATLRWDVRQSPSVTPGIKARLARRLTVDGELIITSQRTRDQQRNVEDCLDKLRALVLAAATPPKHRVPTRPTRASELRRGEDKTRRSARKKDRKPPSADG
jgi:ribosome-associated protein